MSPKQAIDVLREFVLALRKSAPRAIERMVDLDDVPDIHCVYCGSIWDPWTKEHHTDGCVWSPRITEALETPDAILSAAEAIGRVKAVCDDFVQASEEAKRRADRDYPWGDEARANASTYRHCAKRILAALETPDEP